MTQPKEEPLILDMPFGEALERFARINPRIVEEAPAPGKASPFVKWAGGKRSIIEELVKRLPVEFNGYWEPFVGGGALFFNIQERLMSAILSDSNFDLMITYKVVKIAPEALIAKLEAHAKKSDEEYYYQIRAHHNLQDPIDVAARFIYLNKTGYNGLYRVNKAGEFNVPWGRYTNPDVVTSANIMASSIALRQARIEYREFDAIQPQAGDFVYCDPPYHPSSETARFTKYTKQDFSEKDQERLRDFALQLHRQGIFVMLSNSDTPFIRQLYSGSVWHTATVQAPRLINCKPQGRGTVSELVITNYAPSS